MFNYSSAYATIVYFSKPKYLLAYIGRLNKSESINLKYNITVNETRQYVLNPTKLYYKTFLSGGQIIESNPVYFNVIDSLPAINNIEVKPNPSMMSNHGITFKAIFEDKDPYDLSKYELFSSIDGRLDNKSDINSSDTNYSTKYIYNYYYVNKNRTLSEGVHTITFKAFDTDGKYSESTLTLNIENYLLNIIPNKYLGWTFVFALFFIIFEIILRDMYHNNGTNIKKCVKNNLVPILLMMTAFLLCFLLPIFLFSYLKR